MELGISARTLFLSFVACLQLVALLRPGEAARLPKDFCTLEENGTEVRCDCIDHPYEYLTMSLIDPAWKRIHFLSCHSVTIWLHSENGDPINLDLLRVTHSWIFELRTREEEHRHVPVHIQELSVAAVSSFNVDWDSLYNAKIANFSCDGRETETSKKGLYLFQDSLRNAVFEKFSLFLVDLRLLERGNSYSGWPLEMTVTSEWSYERGTLHPGGDREIVVHPGESYTPALKFQLTNVASSSKSSSPPLVTFRVQAFKEATFTQFRHRGQLEFEFSEVDQVVVDTCSVGSFGRNSLRLGMCGCNTRVTFLNNSVDSLQDAEPEEFRDVDSYYRIGRDYFGSLFTRANTLEEALNQVDGKHLLLH